MVDVEIQVAFDAEDPPGKRRKARAQEPTHLYTSDEIVEHLAPGVVRVENSAIGLTISEVRCLLAPGLRVSLINHDSLPPFVVSQRLGRMFWFAWKLAADMESLSDPSEPTQGACYFFYVPPQTTTRYQFRGGALKALNLIATPSALEQRWGLTRHVCELLGLVAGDSDAIRSAGFRRKVIGVPRASGEILWNLLSYRGRPDLLRPLIEGSVLQLICNALETGEVDKFGERLSMSDIARVHRVREAIIAAPAAHYTLHSLARRFGLNRNKLANAFRTQFGTTVFDFVREQRLTLAWSLLEQRAAQVREIARRSGFRDAASFSRAFRSHFGVTPSDVRLR